jgi:hypothetical protein
MMRAVTDAAPQEIQDQGPRVEELRVWAAAVALEEALHPNVMLD